MHMPKIRMESTISKLLSRPSSRCSRRSPPSTPARSYTSSPLNSSPLSLYSESISTYEPEAPEDQVQEEDLTSMEFVEDPEDVESSESDEGIVEEPAGIMDPEYYMEMVVFKVEDGLYRVPVHLFRSCTDFFNPLLDELNNVPENERIIKRDDVNKEDFRTLLKLLYPMSFTLTRTFSDNEWISILRVSTRWLMLDIRRMAIEYLTSASLPLVDRIVLARECSVVSWLRSAYLALVEVDSELSSHDELTAERIGLESSFKLHRVRESVLPQRQRNSRVIAVEMEKEFAAEFEALNELTAIERAVLAQKYGVSEWRRSAFVAMTHRQQLLSVDEAQFLGLETAIRLCGARELRRSLGSDRAVDQELEWDFGALKNHTAVERVVLAREYGVRNWAEDGLLELAEQEESLSIPEARELGLWTAIALCRARHYSRQLSPGEAAYKQALEVEFGEEFEQVEAAGHRLLSQFELPKSEEERLEMQRLEEKMHTEKRRSEEQQEEQLESREMEREKEEHSEEGNQKAELSLRDNSPDKQESDSSPASV